MTETRTITPEQKKAAWWALIGFDRETDNAEKLLTKLMEIFGLTEAGPHADRR
jgi:hypothetical protein